MTTPRIAPTLTPRNRRERRASRRLLAEQAMVKVMREWLTETRYGDVRITFGPGAWVEGDVYHFTSKP